MSVHKMSLSIKCSSFNMADVRIVEEMLNGFHGFKGSHSIDGNNQSPDLSLNARDENSQDMNGPVTEVNVLSELRNELSESARRIDKANSKINLFQDDWMKKNSLLLHFEAEINDLKNDLQRKNEELENANLTILHLTESNQSSTLEKERDKALLLQYKEDANKAFQLVERFKNDLEAKSKLAEKYLEEDQKYKSYINGLFVKVPELMKDMWLNVFGGSSGSVVSQYELNQETTPKIAFQTLLEAAVMAESPPMPDVNVSMFPSYEEAAPILGDNSLENDRGEECLVISEDSADVSNETPSEDDFPTSNYSSVTQDTSSLKRMGSHDESISKVHKRFRTNGPSFEETNSENHNIGLDNDKEKNSSHEIEESSAAKTSKHEVLEEDNETKETAKCDAGRCSVRLERISKNDISTAQLSSSPQSEDSVRKSARKKSKRRHNYSPNRV